MEYKVFESKSIKPTREGLHKIQEAYFNLLEDIYRSYFDEMSYINLSAQEIILSGGRNSNIRYIEEAPAIEKRISEFWLENGFYIYSYLPTLQSLKAFHTKGSSLQEYTNILSKTSLYIHTTLIDDPLHRNSRIYKSLNHLMDGYMYFVYSLVNMLKLKPLVLTDVDIPIAIIVPNSYEHDDNFKALVRQVAAVENHAHFESIFGRKFETDEELDTFLAQINTSQELTKHLKNTDRFVLNDASSNLTIEEFIKADEVMTKLFKRGLLENPPLGNRLKRSFDGRWQQINDLVIKATDSSSIPVLTEDTDWKYLLWKLEYDKKVLGEEFTETVGTDALITNALQNEKFMWLGNIPVNALIKLRTEGIFESLRQTITRDLKEIQVANEKDYDYTVKQISENINNAFREHEKELRSNKISYLKKLGIDSGVVLTEGALCIGLPLLSGNPWLGVITSAVPFVTSKLGLPDLASFKKDYKKYKEKSRKIKNSPVGILFKAKK